MCVECDTDFFGFSTMMSVKEFKTNESDLNYFIEIYRENFTFAFSTLHS